MMFNREEILRRTDAGLDVFRHYIPSMLLGKNFRSPFYSDNKASCNVYKDRNGIYRFKDFGDERYSGDCFWLVSEIYRLDLKNDFKEVIKHLCDDLGINDGLKNYVEISTSKSKEKHLASDTHEDRSYRVVGKYFSPEELAYWRSYGIDFNTLRRFKVKSVATFYGHRRDGSKYKLTSSEKEPLFAYEHNKFVKLYRPFSTMRFLYAGDKPKEYIFGMEQLTDKNPLLFITGGEKDVMSLTAYGFHAIALNSETATLSSELWKELQARFSTICVLYDNDETGIRASEQLIKDYGSQGLKRLTLPPDSGKDISDFFKQKHGAQDLTDLMQTQEIFTSKTKILPKPIKSMKV